MGKRKLGISSIIILLIASYILKTPLQIRASFEQNYQDYIFQYNKYRDAHQQYQVSKGKYLNFKTLTSQIEAQDKTKIALEARTDTITSYLKALNEKLVETKGVSANNLDASSKAIEQKLSFLNNNKIKTTGAATIFDLSLLNEEFKTEFSSISDKSNQILGTIAMTKLDYFFQKYDTQKKLLDDFVKLARTEGKNTENWERQIQTADGKMGIAQDKYKLAKQSFYPTGNDYYGRLDIDQGKINLRASYQYTKDAISFLLETEKTIRGE